MATQPLLNQFLAQSKPATLLLLCHANADTDALASSLALYFSFSLFGRKPKSLGKTSFLPKKFSVTIGVPGHCNSEAQQLASKLKAPFFLNPDLEKFDAILVLDFNESLRAGALKKQLDSYSKPILILDHHLKTRQSLKTAFCRIEPDSFSTSFLVLDELQKSGFSIPKKAFLALAAGMLSDSANLLNADSALLDALSLCLRQTDSSLQEIRSLFSLPIDFSEKVAKLKSLNRLQLFEISFFAPFGDKKPGKNRLRQAQQERFLVALSHTSFFESQSAMALLAAGADLAFVSGFESKSSVCRLVARASPETVSKTKIHLGADICSRLPDAFGGQANGHAGAAGFSALDASPEFVLQKTLELVADFFRKKNPQTIFREII